MQVYSGRDNYIDTEFTIQDNVIAERDAEIKLLYSEMLDINELFRTVGTLIESQSPMIDNIQNNIRHSADNCKIATDNLQKADEQAEKNTSLYAYILAAVTITATLTTTIATAFILL